MTSNMIWPRLAPPQLRFTIRGLPPIRDKHPAATRPIPPGFLIHRQGVTVKVPERSFSFVSSFQIA
jgi:hypothetical protein